jgi:SAM-dependent methyltransferase
MNQVVGKSPLYNRNLLEIADFDTSFAEGFVERGARVTQMRRDLLPSNSDAESALDAEGAPLAPLIAYTPLRIPATDKSFDLVFGTNVLSSVEEPVALINELVRVTKLGGSIHLQDTTWYSPWGGKETSPWHLISGHLARRLYVRRNHKPPRNEIQRNFYQVSIREVMRSLHDDPRIVVVSAHPRYLPESFGWLLRVPVLNELVTMSLSVTLERVSD